jgi:Flp pilus assembly protein TadD
VSSARASWNAAQRAQSLLRKAPQSAEAWTAAGIAHSKLRNFDYARHCFKRALELAPESSACAHNLGHLLDIAFRDYAVALPLLKLATEAEPLNASFAASYAHALAANGRHAPKQVNAKRPQPRMKALLQGLAHLPFTPTEQAQIQQLYRVARKYAQKTEALASYAAATTWLWAQSSGYPLSIGEVAAPFRAPVATVRALAKLLHENMKKASREPS